jgi:hypothetical protein
VIRRVLVVLVALACSFTLASCNNHATHKPSANVSANEASAERFASLWVTTLNKATTSGDTTQLKSLGLKTCKVCADFANQLDQIYGAGGHVTSQGWTIETVIPESGATATQRILQIKAKVAPQTVVLKKGAKPKKYKGGEQQIRMVLAFVNNGWKINRIDV